MTKDIKFWSRPSLLKNTCYLTFKIKGQCHLKVMIAYGTTSHDYMATCQISEVQVEKQWRYSPHRLQYQYSIKSTGKFSRQIKLCLKITFL